MSTENDGWDEDWGSWDEDGEMEEAPGENREVQQADDKLQWLQDCVFSLSPVNDIVAVAHGVRCVLLSRM